MIEIIPAIDIIKGQCVRLNKGLFNTQKIYSNNPCEMAMRFSDSGIKYLHLVDLEGAYLGRVVNFFVLEKIASNTNLIIDYSGGLRTLSDMETVFNAGATTITLGSTAIQNPALTQSVLNRFGNNKLILGADVKDGKIAINGWMESSEKKLYPFLNKWIKQGINKISCTDVSCDGMLKGPAFELYQRIKIKYPKIKLIASGGISCMEDIRKLDRYRIDSVIIGRAIYEGKITIKELSDY
jgi:phosphoribosylformimino-5-aminoimidazole carboxamide ribotide isomerase